MKGNVVFLFEGLFDLLSVGQVLETHYRNEPNKFHKPVYIFLAGNRMSPEQLNTVLRWMTDQSIRQIHLMFDNDLTAPGIVLQQQLSVFFSDRVTVTYPGQDLRVKDWDEQCKLNPEAAEVELVQLIRERK